MTRVLRAAFVAAISGMLCSAAAYAGEEAWTQDYKAALEKAKAESHDLLLDFTGSDWCPPCQRLAQEVFDTEEFAAEATKNFVLVKLDFPNDPALITAEVKKQNEDLMGQFGIDSFPTIFLVDSSGRPYAKTGGYEAGGPEKYLEMLATMREAKAKRDAAFTAAGALEGVAKAKALDESLEQLGTENILPFYRAETDLIVSLDPRDEAGLKTKYEKLSDEYAKRLVAFAEMMESRKLDAIAQEYYEKRDFAGMRKAIEAWAAEHSNQPGLLQRADLQRAWTFDQEENYDEALRLIDEAIKRKPDSELVPQIEGIKLQIENKKKMKAAGGADEGGDSDTEEPAPTGGGH